MSLENLIIVQGRMNSKRFPGKTLYKFHNRASLGHLLDSLKQVASLESIVVATSNKQQDDPIADFSKQEGVNIFRGEEENVASRFKEILHKYRPDSFLRVNADSPLLPYEIVKTAQGYMRENVDFASTFFNRVFPRGWNVEAMKSSYFLKHYDLFNHKDHFEHVTSYFYNNQGLGTKVQILPPVKFSEDFRFCFDTEEDAKNLNKVFSLLGEQPYQYSLEEKWKKAITIL